MGPGGLWCIGDFESLFMGAPFKGHDVMGYDIAKKHYTTMWVDSMTSKMATGTGRWDARTKTLTFDMPGVNMSGEPWIEKHITTFPTPDTMSFRMEAPGEDGKPMVLMTIEYTRRK